MFMFIEEPWTAVSLINSLQNPLKEYSLSPDVPQEKRESLRCTLEETRQVVNDFLTCPSETDLNNDVSTIIAKSQWYPIYQPYSGVLEDLKGNLRASSKLTYQCHVKLQDPAVEPHVARQYHLPSEQKQALENNIQSLIDLGIIETGESNWKCSLFVVPQKVNDAHKKETGWVQVWRVVHDQKPLNMHVKTEEDTLPQIPDIYTTATNKTVFSLIDLKKAFFHCDVARSSRHFFGIPHASMRLHMKKCQWVFKIAPRYGKRS